MNTPENGNALRVGSSDLIAERRATKKLRAELRALVATCESCLSALDREMKQPSNEQRGKRIAYICNQLELQKDMAKHFGLGIPLRADKKPSSAIAEICHAAPINQKETK